MGTTCTRFKYRLEASLLTITAGRVFCISPPRDGSKSTHQTSPRSMRLVSDVSDQSFRPSQRFPLPIPVRSHVAVRRLHVFRQDVWTRKLFQKLTDPPPADLAMQSFVNFIAHANRKFLAHGSIRILHV